MNTPLIIIAVSLAFIVFLGMRAKRGVTMNMEQWSVGGRGFSSVLVFVLMAGELYTTFTFLGASGFAYGFGGPALYIVVYTVLAFVMSYWLLPPVWRYAKQHKLLTQSDYYAKIYGSTALGTLVAVVSLVALIPYLILQFKGIGIIVELTSYGGIKPTAAIWIGAGAMTVYVVNSGMRGSANTALLKDAVVLVVCVFLGLYLPYHYYGGLGSMFATIEQAKPGFLALPETGKNAVWYLSTIAISSLGMYLWPHAFASVYTSKTEISFRKNAVVMPIYALVMLFSMFVGMAAILQVPGLSGGQIDLALLKLSIQTFDPWLVGVIGVAGVLTAIVPGSIMLIASSTLFARNIYLVGAPDTSDSRLSLVSRIAALAISLIAVYFAIGGGQSIVALLIMGFSFVTQLTPGLLASLCKTRIANKYGVATGICVGVGTVAYTVLTHQTMQTLFPGAPAWVHDVNIGVIALGLNTAVMLAVTALTRGLVQEPTVALQSEP
ncbi:MAG TPA: sodium:solute symporter [Eoetvoesiella sp.]|uniref:sodium:solute symporter family protein n=1 Tax=Eoetvoesiella sp. TaxID=1966355 RepID=UPI002C6A4B80|nr:sodium:solute symporter [Eoetvoesiella sp.]HWK60788.1 sodium:solute symporter [Eoetvoesiella sp.]